jgi:hypothetical protein
MIMKHDILEQVWRIRDELSAEAGHDVKRLAQLVAREQATHARKVRTTSRRVPRKHKPSAKAA